MTYQKNVDRVGIFLRTKCFLQLICAEMGVGVFSRHYGTFFWGGDFESFSILNFALDSTLDDIPISIVNLAWVVTYILGQVLLCKHCSGGLVSAVTYGLARVYNNIHAFSCAKHLSANTNFCALGLIRRHFKLYYTRKK